MNRFVVPAVLAGLVGLLAYGLLSSNPDRDPPNALLGKPAPTFALTDTLGKTHDLSALKGKGPVVVNFWASWCVPCRQESPLFAKLSNLPSNVQFLGVLYNDQKAGAEEFSREYGLKYPTLLDPGSKVAMRYGIGQVPVTYIVDPQGQVVYHKLGPVTDEQEFRAALKKAGGNL